MTNISTFPGDTQGRNILKSRTITHGNSGSGEVDTYTLNPGENLIILNNHQGSAGSSRSYAANFTAGIPTALGTVLHLEINSSRTNNSGSQVAHRTAIQFGGTAYLDTGNIGCLAAGNALDAYQRKLQRTIVLTVSGWVDFSLGSRVGGDSIATDIIFKTNENVGQAATGSDSADVERMRIAANGDVTFANSLYIADYIYHSGDTNSYFGWQSNDTFVLHTNGSEALSVGSDNAMTCRGVVDIESYVRHIGDTHTYFGFSGNDNIAFYSGGTHAADIAGNGTFRFYHSMYMADYIYHYSDNNTYFGFSANDTFKIATSGVVRLTVLSGGDVALANWVRLENQYNYGGNWQWEMNNNQYLYLTFNGGNKGHWRSNGGSPTYNFTGQHRTFIKDVPYTQAGALEGLIVSSDQNKYIKMDDRVECGSNAITISESLPVVSVSNVFQDKRCFGVISTPENPDSREQEYGTFVTIVDKEIGDTRVCINSLGEGAIWVSNSNGNLEAGDYITTSNVTGYGQKQDDDILHNYTVAKITMDCDFNPVTQPIQVLKKEFGNVNYWVKTTLTDVSEEEYSNLNEERRTTKIDTYYSNEEGKIFPEEYNNLESNIQSTYTELTNTIYQKREVAETKSERDSAHVGYELDVRNELVNVLDEHNQIQWEDDPTGATEKAYKLRYVTADGTLTDEVNAVHIAAFVGCTYHCG